MFLCYFSSREGVEYPSGLAGADDHAVVAQPGKAIQQIPIGGEFYLLGRRRRIHGYFRGDLLDVGSDQ